MFRVRIVRGDLILTSVDDWIRNLDAFDILGPIGVLAYIGAYLMLQLGILKGDGYMFPALNLLASLAILLSLTRDFNPYSATIEIAWSVISVIGLARLYFIHRFIKLSDEQANVARRLVPTLKKDKARKLIRLGRFIDAEPGQVLATEGVAISDVAMVLDGQCSIERGGARVAMVSGGALVGELTFASGAPATATVRVTAVSRLFVIERHALLGFLARNPEAMADMERSVAGDLRLKLADTTARLSSHMGLTDRA